MDWKMMHGRYVADTAEGAFIAEATVGGPWLVTHRANGMLVSCQTFPLLRDCKAWAEAERAWVQQVRAAVRASS